MLAWTEIFFGRKNGKFIGKKNNYSPMFAKNIDCGYAEAVLTSTCNLYFGSKIRKYVYPCIPHFYDINFGYKGVFITLTCFPDVYMNNNIIVILILSFQRSSSAGPHTL